MSSENQSKRGEPTYDVGYGKPPVHSRFKPGQSGNPKGKKKGTKGFKSVVTSILNEKVSVKTHRGTKKIAKVEALIHANLTNALKGDPKATDRILKLARDVGLTEDVETALETLTTRELSDEDHAILARFASRESESKSWEGD